MSHPAPPALDLEQQRLALLAQIPADELRHFEDYYHGQLTLALQRAHLAAADSAAGAADPDQVERQLIEHLVRQAEGRDHPHGLGAVPISNNLLADLTPPASDPRDTPAGSRERSWTALGRWRLLALAGVLLVALALLLASVGSSERADVAAARQPTATATTRSATPTAIPTALPQEAVEVSFPTSLEFARRDQRTTIVHVMAVTGQLGGMWQPELGAERAAWLNGSFINTVICLPPAQRALVAELERGAEVVMRTASGARRRYEVARVREVGRQATEVLDQRRAGMTLLVCATGENTRTVVETIYRPSAAALAPAAAGVAPLALADLASVLLQRVAVVTPTLELPPDLAEAQLTVRITNLSGRALGWADLVDQLELDGQIAEALPPATPRVPLAPGAAAEEVTFRYLVPRAGGAATWRLFSPTGDTLALQVPIPPAAGADRPAVDAVLPPKGVTVVRGTSPELHLTLTVSTTASSAVALDADDVTVWSGATALPLLDRSTPLPLFVAPDRPQSLTLAVPYPAEGSAVVVQVGMRRWRVQLPGR